MEIARSKRWLMLSLMAMLTANQAFAQETNDSTSPAVASKPDDEKLKNNPATVSPNTGDVSMSIGEVEVTVTGTRPRATDLPGSVDIIGDDQISKQVTDNALDIMRRIPGFAYHDYGNGGVPNGFMMRGFASNHGSDALVVVDGIPINDHFWQADGSPDLNSLTPDEIEHLEVIKGPLDARYGNWSRSGIVQIETRKKGNFFRATAERGSFNSSKAYVSFGSEHFDGKFNQVYSVELYNTDAWRQNSQHDRKNAYAKWFYNPSKELSLGLITHFYKADWSTGGYIGEEQWNHDPRSAFAAAANDGGYKELKELSLHIDYQLLHRIPVQTKVWHRESNASRYADWGGGQTEGHSNEKVTGILVNVDTELPIAANQILRLEGGTDYRYFDSDVNNWNTQVRVRQTLNANNFYNFQNAGLYLKANHDLAKILRLFGGVRHDLFLGRSKNYVTGTSDSMKNYHATSYKGGLMTNSWKGINLYGNVATAFHLPNSVEKYEKNPPNVSHLFFWETGLKASPLNWLTARYAYFQSYEPVVLKVQDEYQDNGKAKRAGHEFEISASPVSGVELFTAATFHQAHYQGGSNDGKLVPIIPRFIWKLGAQAESKWGTGGSFDLNWVGKWNTDDANQHDYAGYRVVDISVYQIITKQWAIAVDVKNLTDVKYSEYVGFWDNSNQYMPSNPRSVFASIRYNQ